MMCYSEMRFAYRQEVEYFVDHLEDHNFSQDSLVA